MRFVVSTFAFVLLLAACDTSESSPTTTAPATTTTVGTNTTVPGNSDICAAGDSPFGTSGLIAAVGHEAADAAVLASLRWTDHGSCERLIVGFNNDAGAPASRLGPTGVSLLAESGIIRLTLPPEVTATAVDDSLIDGSLVHRVYVTRAPEGELAVDVHLAPEAGAQVRALDATSPARLVVDVRPADIDLVVAAATAAADVVLLSPASGPGLYPVRVAGYARPGIPSVRIQMYDEAGALAFDRAVTTADLGNGWAWFDVNLADGPSGMIELYVGELDDLDQPVPDGVTVELDLP
jgi:hypothetical protein